MIGRVFAVTLVIAASPAIGQPSTLECATYGALLVASGESVKALAAGARELDLATLRTKVDEETRRAISRLEDANANLQPPMQEWSNAAADLAARLKAECSR